MEKYKNKYQIASSRAAWWDYSNPGCYFITICSAGRKHIFGRIENQELIPSPIGDIVFEEWFVSFLIRKEISCDAFVLMPNHLHAILRIGPRDTCEFNDTVLETSEREISFDLASLTKGGVAYRAPKSISSFVAGFKAAATKKVNEFRNTPQEPVWLPRYHDYIIRDQKAYDQFLLYILNNPAKWDK